MKPILEQLNKTYFWDVDLQRLDEIKSKRLIIERVMNFGTLQEIKLIKRYYEKKEVIKIICDLNYIDPKTLNFFSLLFNIPKSNFKCYTRKQLNHQHWTY